MWLVLTVDVINSALLAGGLLYLSALDLHTAVVTALGQTSCSSQSRV